MSDTQPNALRLAEYLETYGPRSNIDCTSVQAAAELRRLHEENQRLKAQQTVAWPTMPQSKGQSPVLFEDGYAEGWAKCLSMCKEAVATSPQSAQQQKSSLQDQFDDALNSLAFYKRRVEALQQWQGKMRDPERMIVCDIIANGHTLEPAGDRYQQPAQQEPVAYMNPEDLQKMKRFGRGSVAWATPTDFCTQPVYTRPQAREWVGLTQQDIDIAFDDTQEGGGFDDFARAIEAKLREKNA